ncbi:MAG: RNA polymerase sigma factor (sigma-70 family) [Planctomycetota bacterium]|jgi:RNA polymerase sigma factor (sigma-70 family)
MSDQLHSELQAHATSLRGLARDLLHDKHAAEDVAQQTLTKAWTSRNELQPGPMGGWLQRVLTNFTRQWRRGERRRVAHETRHMIEQGVENQPSPAETLARREALQSVSAAVLQLDEPYQTAVFLRYFEDLPPRVIAHRTMSNVATVKSRIARGLTMLRQRLSQTQGDRDWRTGLAATLGLPIGTALVPITAGVLLMKASMKVTVAAAVLCIGGLYLYGGGDPQPPATTDLLTKTATTAEASEASDHAATAKIDRTPASSYAFEESQLSHPYQLELTVHVVDKHGLPIAGFTPELAPPGGTLRNASESTDKTGTAIIRWPSRQANITIEVLDPRRHRRLVKLRHGMPNHITLVGKSREGPTFSFSIASGLSITSHDISSQLLAGNATSNKLQAGIHPHAVFSESGLVPLVKPVESTEAANVGIFLGETFSLADFSNMTFHSSDVKLKGLLSGGDVMEAEATDYCSIKGFVYGEDGKPKGEVPVVILGSSPQPLHRGKTDKDGAFRFNKLLANTYEVRAGGTELGLAKETIRVDKGDYTQNLILQREACIRGTLLDEAGKAVGKATIEWLSDDGQWGDQTKTAGDGTFLLANLPSTSGSLYVWHEDNQQRFPIAHMTGIRPDSGKVSVTCESSHTGTIRVQPSAVAGCKLNDLRLRLRHVETGFSRNVRVPRVLQKSTDKEGKQRSQLKSVANGPWQQGFLPTGFYEVEMGLAGCGTKNLGRHWVDGKADIDLGTVALAAPGLVHFDVPDRKMPDDLKVEISALRKPFDVRIESLRTLVNDVQLAEGSYVLATQRGELPPQFQTFEMRSDQTTTMRVAW